MNELVSIIVPVYNVEKYLQECLDSLGNQTYQNLEIILVDDGSTDSSTVLCEKAASTDKRIRVLYTDNKGASHARNMGLDVCTGDFVTFCDADDFLALNAIQNMLTAVLEKKCDLVVCARANVYGKTCRKILLGYQEKKCQEECAIHILSDDRCLGGVCNKLFSRRIVGDVRFREEFSHCEDVYFWMEIMAHNQNVEGFFLNQSLYYYRQHENSATNSVNRLFDEDGELKYIKTYRRILKDFRTTAKVKRVVYGKMGSVALYTFYQYRGLLDEEKKRNLCNCINQYIQNYWLYAKDSWIKKIKMFLLYTLYKAGGRI